MKCQIPQISWHSRDPVLSVDFQPIQSNQYRLASGGTDSHVLIWYVTYQENKTVNIECASDLYRHNKSVNVVRFSPKGESLASGDDEGAMFIWQIKERELIDLPKDDDNVNKEDWYPMRLLRGHLEDIYDISWSKDGNFLVSASMDNTAIMWDMQKYVKLHIFSDFKGYVQGVSWDPCNQFIASVGSDRTLRIHNINSKKTVSRISKAPWTNSTEKGTIKPRLFYDDTLKSYCRRLTYTPDGELLIVPSGILEKGEKLLNTCYVFSKHAPSKPVLSLPTGDKYTIAVRCNPFLYKLRRDPQEISDKENELPKPLINLPYRMIFAVAACDSILMYDTEQLLPFAYVSNIHYTHLTDLTWSPDGLTLVASSTDGYCSFVVFTREELGEIYVPEEPKENESEKNIEICKSERMDNTATSDAASVPEIVKEKTPIRSKGTPSTNTKSPKVEVAVPQNAGDESMTPSSKNANSAENKKSAKKSPKMLSIKKFFVSPKTVVSTPVADKTSETVAEKSIKGDTSEPEIITLSDTPTKEKPCSSNSGKGDASAENSENAVVSTAKAEPMDVDKNLTDETSAISKVEKQTKCKVRLDFADKVEPSTVVESPSMKKSPKMSIKKFFMSPKNIVSVATDKTGNTVTKACVKDTTHESLTESEKVILSTPAKREKSLNSTENIDNTDNTPVVKSENPEVFNPSADKEEAMDIDKNHSEETSNIVKSSNPKKQIKSKIEVSFAVNPVMNFDENASDGDNTSTSMSGMTTSNNDEATKESESDWKLELSQDEDIVPMEVAAPAAKTATPKPAETKVTPKRRIALVTLSSKATFK